MNLSSYIKRPGRQAELARSLKVTASFLTQMASGGRPVPAKRCVQIELATRGRVLRQELRPNDWREIWPELAPIARRTGPIGLVRRTGANLQPRRSARLQKKTRMGSLLHSSVAGALPPSYPRMSEKRL